MNEKKTTKTIITVVFSLILAGVGTFLVVYFGYSKYIDNKINTMPIAEDMEVVDTGESVAKVIYQIGSEWDEATELTGKLEAGEIITAEVTYEDGSKQRKECYVVFEKQTEPEFVDGNYGKLVLPMEYKKDAVS